MISRSGRSIRGQLVLMTLLLLCIASFITFFLANSYGKRSAQISYDRLLTSAAIQVAENISMKEGNITVDLPWSAFEILSSAPNDRVFYQIKDKTGQKITGYDGLPTSKDKRQRANFDAPQHKPDSYFFDASYDGEPVRFLIYKKRLTEANYSGDVSIQIGQTVIAREALANEISWRGIQLVFPFISVGFILVMLGIWQLLKPINKLNRTLSSRTGFDLSKIDLPVPTELEQLVQSINHFMGQLENNLNHLQRFTSEAAHQLRTPLAGLKSQAQNALSEEDEDARHKQLLRVIESCDMLNHTVTQLLMQATLSHRFQSQQLTQIDLIKITKSVCKHVVVSALQQEVEIAFEGETSFAKGNPAYILGDEFALEQMLRNILENAIKYSPAHSVVVVSLTKLDSSSTSKVALSVQDKGIGIPDSEKPHVFERFYRSANNPRSGTGLGLAIAKEVVDHHGASLELVDNAPTGLIVNISFELLES